MAAEDSQTASQRVDPFSPQMRATSHCGMRSYRACAGWTWAQGAAGSADVVFGVGDDAQGCGPHVGVRGLDRPKGGAEGGLDVAARAAEDGDGDVHGSGRAPKWVGVAGARKPAAYEQCSNAAKRREVEEEKREGGDGGPGLSKAAVLTC